jgi:two-component system, cell cycle response regulator DivK
MARKTILIVDDSDSICSGIASYLEVNGYGALTAHDGEEGVRVARRERPDVILLDIMMPVLDGWEAMKQLKADVRTVGIPVLALTALRLSADQVSGAGFDGYLSKPVLPHRLIEEIDRVSPGGRAG